jgi:thiamine kinase-like enzyme
MGLSLEEALARVPFFNGASGLKTTPLEGGITNLNYRIDAEGGDSYVLRITGADTELLGINRDAEHQANKLAGELGIAPEVVYFIEPEGYLVTRYVDGRPLPDDEMRKPENIRRVAEAIRKFHTSGATLLNTFNVFRRIEMLTATSQKNNCRFPANFDWLMQRLREVEAALLKDPYTPTPCHDDLLNGNFLDDGSIRILDWEYAGMGDIFFDLANFCHHHHLNEDEVRHWLQSYFGEVTPQRFARLKLMWPMSEIHEAMWGTTQTGISKLDFDFQGYADLWFGRATEALQDPRYSQWLNEVA